MIQLCTSMTIQVNTYFCDELCEDDSKPVTLKTETCHIIGICTSYTANCHQFLQHTRSLSVDIQKNLLHIYNLMHNFADADTSHHKVSLYVK